MVSVIGFGCCCDSVGVGGSRGLVCVGCGCGRGGGDGVGGASISRTHCNTLQRVLHIFAKRHHELNTPAKITTKSEPKN